MKPIAQSADSFFPPAPSNLVYMEDSFNGNTYITSGCFPADAPDRTAKYLAWVGCVVADFDLCDYVDHSCPADKRAIILAKFPGKAKEAIKKWMYQSFASNPEKFEIFRQKHRAVIQDALNQAGLPSPTVLSDSGWGHHALWWLAEPASTPDAIREVRAKNAAIVAAINSVAGFELADPGVHDSGTRLLRENGATNVKSPSNHRPVTPFQVQAEARLDLAAVQVQVGPAQVKSAAVPERLAYVPSALPASVVECMGRHPTVRDLYDGKGKETGDKTGSGYNFSLCLALLSKGITAEDAQATIYLRDIGRGKTTDQATRSAYRIVLRAADKVASGRIEKAKEKEVPAEIKDIKAKLDTKENGDIKYTLQNTVKILGLDATLTGQIWMDVRRQCACMSSEVKKAIGIVGQPPEQIKDTDLIQLRYYFAQKYDYEPSKLMMQEAVDCVAEQNPKNTLGEYLEGTTSKWDRTYRIDTWLIKATGCEDTPLMRAYSRKFLLSAVARALKPGCKVDTMLVLRGAQGIGKSTLFEVLAGEQNYSNSKLDIGNKDALLQIHRSWIYEVAEMISISKKEAEEVKEFLTTRIDNFRAPYERASIEHPRPCIFVGTTNRDTFLLDPTGARRYWPITCGNKIDLDWVAANRDQLWGEAMMAFHRGEKWWLNEDEVQLHSVDTQKYEVEDPTAQALSTYLSGLIEEEEFTLADALEALGIRPENFGKHKNKIGDLLKHLGCEKVGQKLKNGARVVMWLPPKGVAARKDGGRPDEVNLDVD